MIQLNENSKLHRVLVELSRVVFFKDSTCSDIEFDSRLQLLRSELPMSIWMTYYVRYRQQPRYRVPQAIRDFFLGIKDRFPLCCILHFCWGTFWNEAPQGTKRGERHTKNGTPYVPCFYHGSR